MFDLLSIIFKYFFVFIIYMFIFVIIRMIYLDIRAMETRQNDSATYIKLLNRLDSLPYRVEDSYSIEDELTLGRGKDNSIVIKDPYISKHHFKISKDEGQYFIVDLESSNGTYLNRTRISDASRIANGDVIGVGELEFIFVNRM